MLLTTYRIPETSGRLSFRSKFVWEVGRQKHGRSRWQGVREGVPGVEEELRGSFDYVPSLRLLS